MSLLDNDSIEVKLYYTFKQRKGGRKQRVILEDKKAEELLKDPAKAETVEVLTTQWRQLSWKEDNKVTEAAYGEIDATTGARKFNFVRYRDSIVKECLRDWDLQKNGQKVPVNKETIDSCPADIISALYLKFESFITLSGEELQD